MIYAEILAGGIGSRMGLDIPKQFVKIKNREAILYTIDSVYNITEINKIIICLQNEWKDYMIKIIEENYDINRFDFVESGSDRNDTMIKGCNYINEKYGVNDKDIIITIDAVRIFVTSRIIKDNIEAAKKHDVVGTFFPITDMVMKSIDGIVIDEVPPRKYMYNVQAPQTFNMKKLMKYYNCLSKEVKESLTDVTGIFFVNNEKTYMVKGEETNIKLTYQSDIVLAEKLLSLVHYKDGGTDE